MKRKMWFHKNLIFGYTNKCIQVAKRKVRICRSVYVCIARNIENCKKKIIFDFYFFLVYSAQATSHNIHKILAYITVENRPV